MRVDSMKIFFPEARRAQKCLETNPPFFRVWMTAPPPYLKVWIRQ